MVTASAPGKLMLVGEHAVVYQGFPCIVTAVDVRYHATVTDSDTEGVTFDVADDSDKSKRYQVTLSAEEICDTETEFDPSIEFVAGVIRRVFNHIDDAPNIQLSTQGPDVKYGLGSSSAITVATIAALNEHLQLVLSQRELFDLAYQAVLDSQGKASGFDIAAALYGGTLYFVSGGKEIMPLNLPTLPIIIGYTGYKYSSRKLIAHVTEQRETYPDIVTPLFEIMREITEDSRMALINSNWQQFGDLANLNHGLLAALTVSSTPLTTLIYAARDGGALGAKLSGAGGGDCMFAVVDEASRASVREAMKKACDQINANNPPFPSQLVDIQSNAEGVRIE